MYIPFPGVEQKWSQGGEGQLLGCPPSFPPPPPENKVLVSLAVATCVPQAVLAGLGGGGGRGGGGGGGEGGREGGEASIAW